MKIRNPHYFRLAIKILILTLVSSSMVYFSVVFFNTNVRASTMEEKTYVSFMDDADDGKINTVYFSETYPTMYVLTSDNSYYKVSNPNYEGFKEKILNKNIIVKQPNDLKLAENSESTVCSFLTLYIFFEMCFIIMYFAKAFVSPDESKMIVIGKQKVSANGKNATVSETKAECKSISVKTFKDIAGLKEVKKDISCLVDFLTNREKYEEAGAKLPKGVIFYGPPGTGKTLLAKAIAGEANVPFISMSGSEFIEMYVGVGAKRVRELFKKARQIAPCIVFIDEIDAIGGMRGGKDSNSEDRKTINALLTEMDGFKENENIIVIGATNRLEDLDPALVRPGRFTNKYCVPLPETIEDRLEVINLYIKNKKLDESVDLKALAKETVGFSPAKIEALLNEASIISVQDDSRFITKEIIDKAMYKILLQGHMKEDVSERDKEELNVVAWHEAGHAVIGHLFGKDITKVTIIPSTSGAGGVTFSTPTKIALLSAEDIKHEIMELYGGRLAELLYYKGDKNKITTGASNDIERATDLINGYVTRYGMSNDFGMLNLSSARVDNKEIIFQEVSIAKELESATKEVLEHHYKELQEIAHRLIEENTIYNAQIKEIFEKCA